MFLVLHFVKTINSNIIIQLKIEGKNETKNIFSMLCVLQHKHHLISSQSTHFICQFCFFLSQIRVPSRPLRIQPHCLPCRRFQMSGLVSNSEEEEGEEANVSSSVLTYRGFWLLT